MAAVVSGVAPGTIDCDGPEEEGSARRCGSGRAAAASPGRAARDERLGVGDGAAAVAAAAPPRSHVQTQQQQQQQQQPTASRRRHRRRPSKKKQRRWRPYLSLSWDEKKAMEERESERAARMRAEMAAKGLAVAPYNTTQFLMDEHDREEPDLEPAGSDGDNDGDEDSEEGEDGGGEGGDDELPSRLQGGRDGFLQRDFSETYERYHVESLNAMSKGELVREYLELEKCLSRLEEENLRLRECLGERGCWRGPAVALETKPASRPQAPLAAAVVAAAAAAPSSLRSPPAAEIVTQQQQQHQSTEGSGGGVEAPCHGEDGSLAKSHDMHAGGGGGDVSGKQQQQLVVDLQAEVERLQRENGRLAHQNELLQQKQKQQSSPEANVME
ncbi:protein HEXIM2-like [Lethenteron reissneri]|uniref:protein HEXIM2-like n=1 Tax=Lethenteron reissneri TaxID=7753 RepID=UPI002AB76A06|nr:protein HEXIM2-like [Lethenteron reissneri]